MFRGTRMSRQTRPTLLRSGYFKAVLLAALLGIFVVMQIVRISQMHLEASKQAFNADNGQATKLQSMLRSQPVRGASQVTLGHSNPKIGSIFLPRPSSTREYSHKKAERSNRARPATSHPITKEIYPAEPPHDDTIQKLSLESSFIPFDQRQPFPVSIVDSACTFHVPPAEVDLLASLAKAASAKRSKACPPLNLSSSPPAFPPEIEVAGRVEENHVDNAEFERWESGRFSAILRPGDSTTPRLRLRVDGSLCPGRVFVIAHDAFAAHGPVAVRQVYCICAKFSFCFVFSSVFFVLSLLFQGLPDYFLLTPSQEEEELPLSMARSETVIVECRVGTRKAAFDMFSTPIYSALAAARAARLAKAARRGFYWNNLKPPGRKEEQNRIGKDVMDGQDRRKENEELEEKEEELEEEKDIPVLLELVLVVMDSTSRAGAIRHLPKTLQLLSSLDRAGSVQSSKVKREGGVGGRESSDEKEGGGYRVFDFQRFNVLGTGTSTNLPPLLTGLLRTDLTTLNAKAHVYDMFSNQTQRGKVKHGGTPEHPSLFDVFTARGAVTALVEETCFKSTGSLGRIWNGKASGDLDERQRWNVVMDAGKLADHSLSTAFCEAHSLARRKSLFDHDTAGGACFGGKFIHQ